MLTEQKIAFILKLISGQIRIHSSKKILFDLNFYVLIKCLEYK